MTRIWTNGRKSLQIPVAPPTSTGQRAVKLRKWKRKVLKRRRKSQRNPKSQKRRKRGAITHRLHQKVTDNLPCVIKKLWRLVIFFLLRLVEILPSLSIVMQIVKNETMHLKAIHYVASSHAWLQHIFSATRSMTHRRLFFVVRDAPADGRSIPYWHVTLQGGYNGKIDFVSYPAYHHPIKKYAGFNI